MSKLIWRGGWNEVWLSDQEVVIKRKDVEPIVFQSEYFTEIAEQWLTDHAGYDVVKREPEIAPCPFCKNKCTTFFNPTTFIEQRYMVVCRKCGYHSPFSENVREATRLHNLLSERN